MFQRTGSFKKNKINLAEKASKAMYDILNKGSVHNLSVSVLDLFDKIIIPMLIILKFKFIGNLPFEKTMTLDLFVFTFKFHFSQYS
jgi:hypothetical protein